MGHSKRIIFVFALSALAWLVLASAPAYAASIFGQPQPGKHIYDHAGVLSSADITDLEGHAQRVVQAGTPVIVYLQAKDASYNETLQDAHDLMDAWSVQSSYGAHDGVVIFVNLTPGDLHHGQVALYAGQARLNGALPQSELQRIYSDAMLPDLKNHQIAAALGAGLDAITNDLANGGPATTGGQSDGSFNGYDSFAPLDPVTQFLGRGPLALIGWLLGGGVLGYALWRWHAHPQVPSGSARTTPPDDLAPAIVGALITGKVTDAQMEATILDLARRGALGITKGKTEKTTVFLYNQTLVHEDYEQQVWQALKSAASKDNVISDSKLYLVRRAWVSAQMLLDYELRQRGWFTNEPQILGRTLLRCGLAMVLFTLLGEIISLNTGGGFGLLLFVLLFAAIIAAFSIARRLPQTTAAGERVAAPWRGYLASVEHDATSHMDEQHFSQAAIYAIAVGAASTVDALFHEASVQGKMPRWLSPTITGNHGLIAAATAYHGTYYRLPFIYTPHGGGFSGGGFTGGGFSGGGGAGAGGGGGGGGF